MIFIFLMLNFEPIFSLRSGHATAMGAFVRTRGPTEESNGAEAPGTLSGEGDDPRKPLDSMRTPKTPLDGR